MPEEIALFYAIKLETDTDCALSFELYLIILALLVQY